MIDTGRMQNKLIQQESAFKKLSSHHRQLSCDYRELSSDHHQLLKRVSFLENELSIVKTRNTQLQNQLDQAQHEVQKPALNSPSIKMGFRIFHGSPSIEEAQSDTKSHCGQLTNIELEMKNVQLPAQVKAYQQKRCQHPDIPAGFPK